MLPAEYQPAPTFKNLVIKCKDLSTKLRTEMVQKMFGFDVVELITDLFVC